jgi:superfamily I DNA/RNA helicase
MTHIKSNSLSEPEIESRLYGNWKNLKSDRADLFLELYWLIHTEWNRRLDSANLIDFEDMLIQASQIIENKQYIPDYDLILVDEFQDSSSARARLVKSLIQSKGKYVLAVGDDWQSINRFAGADVSLMAHFHIATGPAAPTSPSADLVASVAPTIPTKTVMNISNAYSTLINLEMIKANNLTSLSPQRFVSDFNKVN